MKHDNTKKKNDKKHKGRFIFHSNKNFCIGPNLKHHKNISSCTGLLS